MHSRHFSSRYLTSLLLVAAFLFKLLLFDHLCFVVRPAGMSLLCDAIAALILAGVCLLPRKPWLAWVCCLSLDVWLISNCIYFRANGLFLTWQVMQLAGNMSGFWSSLFACMQWQLILFPLLSTLALTAVYLQDKHYKRLYLPVGLFFTATLLYLIAGNVRYNTKRNPAEKSAVWWSLVKIPQSEDAGVWAVEYNEHVYLRSHSILAFFLKVLYDAVPRQEKVVLSPEEENCLQTLLSHQDAASEPSAHMVFFLVESMEGWVLDYRLPDGSPLCPNIRSWMDSHPSLYSPAVICQKKYGESGDGQMICMTGLLPVNDGVACNSYGHNVFPNFAHFFPQSAVINPCTYMWNQDVVSYSYGFRQLIEPVKETPWWNDSIVVDRTISFLDTVPAPACVLAITVDSHMPFAGYEHLLSLPDSVSETELRYLSSFRHVDDEIGRFFAWADTADVMKNATIVLTGDHYAFYDGLSSHQRHRCPLMITSPSIQHNIRPRELYQMDIFPTVLDAIGQNDYLWHGFGMSAFRMDMSLPADEQTRPCSTAVAYSLSDKLIRLNYFSSLLSR